MKIREEWKALAAARRAPEAYHRQERAFADVKNGRAFALLLLLAGAACLLFTEPVYTALPYLLGGVMMALGLGDILCGLLTGEFRSRETKLTANGVVFFFLGAVILYHRADADGIIGSIWGVLGLVKGAEALNTAMYCCAEKSPFLGKTLQAAVELLLAILLLVQPDTAVRHHVFLLGLELALVGWQLLRESRGR
ncbi:MAG: hypothetical protein ACI3WR_04300 [Oscillospiraceae bacterium]